MLRYIFFFLLLCHGLIHLMGFAKAFGYSNLTRISSPVSKKKGFVWLIVCLLLVISATGFLLKSAWWPVVAILAIVISQVVIFASWKDSKFGTIPNLIILLVVITVWSGNQFESQFIREVKAHLGSNNNSQKDLLTETDILSLPPPVQKYIRYSGAIGKPKLNNLRISFEGEMRGREIDWFPFTSIQYNFFNDPARLFFIRGKMYGLNVPGYHDYQNGRSRMNIKLFGTIRVVHAEGAGMDKTETVTYFNDLCLFAPAALIDNRILWTTVDSTSVQATFTNGLNKISAWLYFNKEDQLVNFISDDRSPIDETKAVRFSTPVKNYKSFNGRNIPTYGEAVWQYPGKDFVYGKFNLKSIEYNVSEIKK